MIVLVPAVGFVSGVAEFYAGTVIALLLLAAGLHLAEAPQGPLGFAWRDDPGGRLLRQLLPVAVLAPLILHVLQKVGAHEGLCDHESGIGVLLISFIVVLSAVLWRGAQQVSTEAARLRVAEAEVRWRAHLSDLVQDAILVWSPIAGIEHWNRGAQELYGYTPAEALGHDSHAC